MPQASRSPSTLLGATAAASFSFPPMAEGDFTFQTAGGEVQNTGNSITLTLGGASDKSRVLLFYPLLPYKRWDISDQIVLEKIVDGVSVARIAVPTSRDEKLTNQFAALRLSVRKTRLAAYRDSTEIAAVDDKSGKPLNLQNASWSANCWSFAIKGLTVTDASGAALWDDRFATDSTARYRWDTSPRPGLNALWVWGWYGMAFDSYRFVPGAVGAQLTSFHRGHHPDPNQPRPEIAQHDRRPVGWKLGAADAGAGSHGNLGSRHRTIRHVVRTRRQRLRPSLGGIQFRRQFLYRAECRALGDDSGRRPALQPAPLCPRKVDRGGPNLLAS